MRHIISLSIIFTLLVGLLPSQTRAAAGIFASGGGTKTVGQSFTVTVKASGTTFDSLQGSISVSGPVSVTAFSAGGATWLPGKSPSNGNTFVGITSATSSVTVATITLKGTGTGSGSVNVSGAKLAKSGSIVATESGGVSFTINRAPTPPGGVEVKSATHPDQNTAYDARTIELAWTKANGVTGFQFGLDQTADTTPSGDLSQDTTAKYENKEVGTYYFHIRAKNGDGFGPTTHFKITIKPGIDTGLAKPTITGFTKTETFASQPLDGTVSGFLLTGTSPVEYAPTITVDPAWTLPEGKNLSPELNADGIFSLLVDFPVKSGFYKLTVQGKKGDVLTPVSDTYLMEASVANGGSVRFITAKDSQSKKIELVFHTPTLRNQVIFWGTIGGTVMLFAIGAGITWWYFLHHRQKSKSSWKPAKTKPASDKV